LLYFFPVLRETVTDCFLAYLALSDYIFKQNLFVIMEAIKPGPKPKTDDGKDDKRRRVLPETKPKHPDLKPHIHKPKD
jgi:hypothetical protein